MVLRNLNEMQIPEPLGGVPGAGEEGALEVLKTIYVIVFREGETMRLKIGKACDSFSRDRFEIADDSQARSEGINRDAQQAERLLKLTRERRRKMLLDIVAVLPNSNVSKLAFQKFYIEKEKALYATMDLFNLDRSFLAGLCWCPVQQVTAITEALAREVAKGHNTKFKRVEEHTLVPPTYLQVNEFTGPFQEIVSTYGTPTYQEVNPAFFTTITFPFLFGVMFGDICHGFVLICISLALCLAKNSFLKADSLFKPLVSVRYLLLLMGIFATFCGFIYNDFAGLTLNMFPSCFKGRLDEDTDTVVISHQRGCSYPFGLDPFWRYSKRELQFENSFKMKLAVILGVLQMGLGVILKLVNSVYFGKTLDVIFEFIPQIVFLVALFGYMDALIIGKWLTHYDDTTKAPLIITAIIDLFIGFGKTIEDGVFPHQSTINMILLFIIIACIPLMLLPKPLILKCKYGGASGDVQHSPVLSRYFVRPSFFLERLWEGMRSRPSETVSHIS